MIQGVSSSFFLKSEKVSLNSPFYLEECSYWKVVAKITESIAALVLAGIAIFFMILAASCSIAVMVHPINLIFASIGWLMAEGALYLSVKVVQKIFDVKVSDSSFKTTGDFRSYLPPKQKPDSSAFPNYKYGSKPDPKDPFSGYRTPRFKGSSNKHFKSFDSSIITKIKNPQPQVDPQVRLSPPSKPSSTSDLADLITSGLNELKAVLPKLEVFYKEDKTVTFAFTKDKVPDEKSFKQMIEVLSKTPMEKTEKVKFVSVETSGWPCHLIEKEGRRYLVFPEQISNGNKKRVYLGLDVFLGKLRIITELRNFKEMKEGKLEEDENYEIVRLYPEIVESIKQCHTPGDRGGVVPIYDVIDIQENTKKWQFTVQEFCLNTDLISWYLAQEKLEVTQLRQIALDAFKGLSLMHKNKLLHKDLKPENFFLDEKGRAYLGDFDFTRFKDETELNKNPHYHRKFNSVSTPEYTPPEFFFVHEYNEASEVWSLALTLFTIFSGCTPGICSLMGQQRISPEKNPNLLKLLEPYLPWSNPPEEIDWVDTLKKLDAHVYEQLKGEIALPTLLYWMLKPAYRCSLEIAYEIFKTIPLEKLMFEISEDFSEEEGE